MKELARLLCFGGSSCLAILVNKYVLWHMKFTYPTIFQSWQMCFASFLLFSFHLLGYLPSKALKKYIMLKWFPGTVLFSLIIYSGSVSLARLPVPLFAVIQQSVLQNMSLLMTILNRKQNKLKNIEVVLFLLNGSFLFGIFIVFNKNLFGDRLKWMVIHCSASCSYSYFASRNHHLELKEYDKLMINSMTSIILLLSVGVVTGETQIVFDFPLLYAKEFMTACMCSGIFGAIVMISYCYLCNEYKLERVRYFNTLVMLSASILSILVYGNNEFSSTLSFMILMTFLLTCFISFFIQRNTEEDTRKMDRTPIIA